MINGYKETATDVCVSTQYKRISAVCLAEHVMADACIDLLHKNKQMCNGKLDIVKT